MFELPDLPVLMGDWDRWAELKGLQVRLQYSA